MTTETILGRLYSDVRIVGTTGKIFDSRIALSSPNNLKEIERLVRQTLTENTLEIGMAFGGSSLIFASVGREVCAANYHHVAIDPYQTTVWDGVGVQSLQAAGLADCVELVEEQSCLALPRLLAEGRRFGLIYVDGSHLFEDVFVDAYFSARLLVDDGFILFDDSSNKHVAKTLAFIESNLPSLKRLPDRSVRQRIARLMGKRQLTIYRRAGPIERSWASRFRQF
jgi:predicted O-methyltransferase YrrM